MYNAWTLPQLAVDFFSRYYDMIGMPAGQRPDFQAQIKGMGSIPNRTLTTADLFAALESLQGAANHFTQKSTVFHHGRDAQCADVLPEILAGLIEIESFLEPCPNPDGLPPTSHPHHYGACKQCNTHLMAVVIMTYMVCLNGGEAKETLATFDCRYHYGNDTVQVHIGGPRQHALVQSILDRLPAGLGNIFMIELAHQFPPSAPSPKAHELQTAVNEFLARHNLEPILPSEAQ